MCVIVDSQLNFSNHTAVLLHKHPLYHLFRSFKISMRSSQTTGNISQINFFFIPPLAQLSTTSLLVLRFYNILSLVVSRNLIAKLRTKYYILLLFFCLTAANMAKSWTSYRLLCLRWLYVLTSTSFALSPKIVASHAIPLIRNSMLFLCVQLYSVYQKEIYNPFYYECWQDNSE